LLGALQEDDHMRILGTTMALAAVGTAAAQGERETVVVANAIEVLKEVTAIPERSIPPHILADAEGFIIVPGLMKLGFVVGGKHGRGLAVMRKPDGMWSNPVMIKLTGGSIGWQAGVESSDLLLVVRKRRTVEEILTSRKFTLGANAGLAVGPLGRDLQAKTDTKFRAEMYSYSRSRGLFAGVSIEGGSVHVDNLGNNRLYRTDLPPLQLSGAEMAVPEEVAMLKGTLLKLSPPPKPPADAKPPAPDFKPSTEVK
jgi:lipid-binding SYLF domain-containing protein